MNRITRRHFIKASALATGLTIITPSTRVYGQNKSPANSYAANEKLNIAGIGVGGRGNAHVEPSLHENLVAICDVSQNTVRSCLRQVEKYNKDNNLNRPLPKTFSDYREMFDAMSKDIDAIFCGAPDNHHAPASMLAITRKKHVYCEKPLTHDIYEARQLTLAAKKHNVATQLGNQGRASEAWRVLCEVIWAGVIGDVTEVHAWTDRPGIPGHPWWPQGGARPAGSDRIPSELNWNAWLGPAPERPFVDTYKDGKFKGQKVYHPFVWRGWWDFGTGALGDIGCHSLSGIFTALKIQYAAGAQLLKDSGDGSDEMPPSASVVRWDIPARDAMPPCKIFWYDGGYYPSHELAERPKDQPMPEGGMIVVGTKGKLNIGGGGPRLIPESKMKDFKKPAPIIPRCESDHFQEWVTAAKGGRPAFSNFDHAGPLTEMVLLGNLAIHAGLNRQLDWDGPAMRCTNLPDLNRFVKRTYRKGWSLDSAV